MTNSNHQHTVATFAEADALRRYADMYGPGWKSGLDRWYNGIGIPPLRIEDVRTLREMRNRNGGLEAIVNFHLDDKTA